MISFDLLIPSNGQGPSHLRAERTAQLVCGLRTGRKLFQTVGIVTSDASTCPTCRAGARELERRTV